MTDVRYLGTTHWTRTVLTEDGKFKSFDMVEPGAVVSVDGDVAKRLLSGPRYNRLFVEAGGSEDPNSEDYVRTRSIGDGGGYVAQDVGLEFTTSNTPRGVTFRTEDDNEEGYRIVPPGEGSDNAALVEADEIQAEADEAKAKAVERRRSGNTPKSTGGKPSPGPTGSSPSSGR